MPLCKWCQTPIQKIAGDEGKPDRVSCWIHTTGFYQCPGSRSEYDLAEYDPAQIAIEATPTACIDGAGI